jgi:hypothetical protein
MAGNPRTVAVDTWITWDGVRQRLPRGQVMDVTPGSALERAIGRERLVPRGPDPAPAEEAAPEEEAAPAKPRAVTKKQDDDIKAGDP